MSKYRKEDKNIERMNNHVGRTLRGKATPKDIKYKVINAVMGDDGVPTFTCIVIGGLVNETQKFEMKGWKFNDR